MNIVSTILQFLAPALVNKLASALGINPTIAQKIIAVALPTILAGLVGKASSPAGARDLVDVIGKQDPGLLGNLGSLIGGPGQKAVADSGIGALGSLLGNSGLGALTGAVGKFTGASDTATTGLLGMLAPAVLGTLGQQQKAANLDAGGLATMLMGQKDYIRQAIPDDFAKLLGGTGLIDSIAAKPAAAQPAPRPTPAPASTFNWWPWFAALAVALLGWWYWTSNSGSRQVTIPQTPRIMVGNTNVAEQFATTMTGMRTSLLGVKDATSAQAALPRLREMQTEVDRLGGAAGQLSVDNKKAFAAFVAQWLPVITPMINGLLANSAVGPIVKPVLDSLTNRLNGMAKG